MLVHPGNTWVECPVPGCMQIKRIWFNIKIEPLKKEWTHGERPVLEVTVVPDMRNLHTHLANRHEGNTGHG